jgi:hypothetical protein
MMIAGLCFSSAAAAAGTEKEEKLMAKVLAAESRRIALPISAEYVPASKRPAILPALYATLGAMQAWDLYSTSVALKAGAHEANPTAAAFVGNKGSMVAFKAATTASAIFFAERAWKKNRATAVVMLMAINGATAAVAMRNMQNARLVARR